MGFCILSAGFSLAAFEEVHYKCLSHDPLNQTPETWRISNSNKTHQSCLISYLLMCSSLVSVQ